MKLPILLCINFFKDVGEVVHVRLIVKHRVMSLGYGSVEFASANEAKKAQEKKNGEYLCGNKITLDLAKIAPYPPRPRHCIEHKVWSKDYLRRESFLIEEEETPPHFSEAVAAREDTLLVANLSPQTKIMHIIKFFECVGNFVRVRLIVNHEDKHVGYGFVQFASAYQAKKALEEKNGEYLNDHKIFLDLPKTAPYSPRLKFSLAEKLWYEHYLQESLLIDETLEGPDATPNFDEAVAVRKKTLFVSHLSPQTKMSDIINFFKDVGEVVHVRRTVDRQGKPYGYAIVEFASANEAKKAQEKKNGEYLCSNMITLDMAEIDIRPNYCIDHKVWYEDYLRRESLLIEEDEAVERLDETPEFVEIQEVAVRKKTLFINNVPTGSSIPEITYFFKDVGEVISVRLIVDYEGKRVGCGFVEFASANEAKKALKKKNGERLRNSYIVLDVTEIAPYPVRPKYNLAEKLWYQDYLRRESLLIEEDDDLETKPNQKKQTIFGVFCGKKIIFSDND